ncbi:MAG: tape measure protein [Clostridia bacterium]|nr:tape measure protein [Clostridia bacterium]
MATIRTAIMVQDSMSPAIRSMSNACRILLNNFEDIQRASSNTVDIQSLKAAREELNNTDMILNQIEQSARDVNQETKKMPSNFNNAASAANGLLNKVKQVALAAGGITLIGKTVELSDQVSSNRARLELIVDDNDSVENLENKIFAMSNRTRSSFLDTTSVVSKLGILAGDNFKNTDEIIAFTELMNKNFAIGGASIQEQTSAMYQLTQAMAAGKLQGDEFRSIMENAPLLAEAIANYTGKSKGELKELSSEGLITSDIIKNAMFSAADEINDRYSRMPMTWSQIWTKMKNITIKALDPVLKKINQLANNPQVQEMFNAFVSGASLAAQAVLWLIEGMAWLYNILEPFAPLILGIVAAYIAFNAISAITSAVLGIISFAHQVKAAAAATDAIATAGATGAQWSLNAALYACPIVWIIVLIVALIAALTYLWFTNDKVAYAILYLWDMLVLGGMTMWLGLKTVFYGLVLIAQFFQLGMIGVCYGVLWAWYMFQTGLEGVGVGILYIFQWLYNGVVGIVNGIISVLNKIPGVSIDMAEYANFADNALEGMMDNVARRNEDLQSMVDDMNEVNNSINENKAKFAADLSSSATDIQNKVIELESTRQDRTDHRNDWINGATSAINDALSMDGFDFSNMGDGTLGDIAGDTSKIAENSEVSEEDLKYLIDLAEREVVNRFTTASVNITMTNNNSINQEQDIDGIVETLAIKLEEELQSVADGVHT